MSITRISRSSVTLKDGKKTRMSGTEAVRKNTTLRTLKKGDCMGNVFQKHGFLKKLTSDPPYSLQFL